MNHIANDLDGPIIRHKQEKHHQSIRGLIAGSIGMTIAQDKEGGNGGRRPPDGPPKGEKERDISIKGQS